MIDRHLVADLGLAALIALPAALPVAQSPRSADSPMSASAPSPVAEEARGGARLSRAASPSDRALPG